MRPPIQHPLLRCTTLEAYPSRMCGILPTTTVVKHRLLHTSWKYIGFVGLARAAEHLFLLNLQQCGISLFFFFFVREIVVLRLDGEKRHNSKNAQNLPTVYSTKKLHLGCGNPFLRARLPRRPTSRAGGEGQEEEGRHSHARAQEFRRYR